MRRRNAQARASGVEGSCQRQCVYRSRVTTPGCSWFFDVSQAAAKTPMNSALARVPAADIREEPGRFMRYADLPGVDPQDIEVQMERGLPTVEGERRVDASGENGNYSRIERMHGVFHRRFALPDSADPEGITASASTACFRSSRTGFRNAATPQVGSVLQS